jgi:hypothetical protein
MRAIIVSDAVLDSAFEECRRNLELDSLRAQAEASDPNEKHAISSYYRKVNYEICCLQDRLRKGPM